MIKKTTGQPETITLLDKGCEFQGKLSFEGVVRIDGIFHGEIFSQDHLIIGEGAKVDATIQVGKLEIGGEFKGKITSRDELLVHGSAKVSGEIETKSLQVASGAVIDASIEMTKIREAGVENSRPGLSAFGEGSSLEARSGS